MKTSAKWWGTAIHYQKALWWWALQIRHLGMTVKSRELLTYLFIIKEIIIWSGINVWKYAVWLGKCFRIHTFKCLIAVEEPAFSTCSIYLVYKEIQNSLTLKQLVSSEAHGFRVDRHIIRVFKLHKVCPNFLSVYSSKKMWKASLTVRKVLSLSRKIISPVCKEWDLLNLISFQFNIRDHTQVRRKLLTYPCIIYHEFTLSRDHCKP